MKVLVEVFMHSDNRIHILYSNKSDIDALGLDFQTCIYKAECMKDSIFDIVAFLINCDGFTLISKSYRYDYQYAHYTLIYEVPKQTEISTETII